MSHAKAEVIMRLVAVTCVRNEIDIIEAFARHTLALVDHLVVLDNGSQDGTGDVLRALAKEGLPLKIVEDPSLGQYQWQRMTYLMREWAVGRYGADWVVALDGDEFLVTREEPLIPEEAATDRPISLPWRTYVPDVCDDAAELNPVLRIRRRRMADNWEPVKVMVPKTLAALPNAHLAQGSHELFVDGQHCEPRSHGRGYLAHFPLRSPGQYAEKIVISSLQHQAMAIRGYGWAYHYKDHFELLKRNEHALDQNLSEAAQRYAVPADAPIEPGAVVDPIAYQGGPLRYTPRVDDTARAWCALLNYAEDLARQHAVLTAGLTEDQRHSAQQQAAVVADLYAQLEQQRKDFAALTSSMNTQLEEQQKERAAIESQLTKVRQSHTWRIGRLFVGPAAWARRSQHQCSQALTHKLKVPHSRLEGLSIPYLEIHVAHNCNLNCESCSHYSNRGRSGIVGLEEADQWMKLWNQRINLQRFGLLGGEPALHPRLCEFVQLARRNWPHTELELITNGMLLKKHPDLPAVLRDTDTCLKISVHHRSSQYQERFEPVQELVEAWVAQYGIRLEYVNSYRNWMQRYRGFGSAIVPFEDRQPRLSWERCPARGCAQLFEGAIWKCAPLAYLQLQARKFDLSDQWKPYLDYQPLLPGCTSDDLEAFFARQEEPFCGMCPSKVIPLELPLPFPASTFRETRRLVA